MAKPLITEEDYIKQAKKLKVEVATIKAVAEVESRGKGFYSDGFPVILFERHKFRQFTKGKFNKSHPHLSGPRGNYGPAGAHQRKKFSEAFALDPNAAMMSCSWGKFQIMGFNYKESGFNTVGEFVDAMKESEGKHLEAFVNFVIANDLDVHLRTKNWAKFARGYNGPAYKDNAYDVKMAKAYQKYLKQANKPMPAPIVKEETKNVDVVQEKEVYEEEKIEVQEEIKEEVKPSESESAVVIEKVEPKETSGPGAWSANVILQKVLAVMGAGSFAGFSFLEEPLYAKIALIGFGVIVVLSITAFLITMVIKSKEKREREKLAHELTLKELEIASDPNRTNVVVK